MDFVEICNVYIGKMIIKAAKRIFNSDKICRSLVMARYSHKRHDTIRYDPDMMTVEGAGLAIADWPLTFGLRPLGDRHLSRL